MRVLIIEDEAPLARSIQRGLIENHFAVDVVGRGEEGVAHASATPYDAVLLDLGLPGMDGMTVLRRLRGAGISSPVLVLTARDALADKIAGLDAGADDYLTKPFSFLELLARLRALLRRPAGPQASLQVADLRMDLGAHRVTRGAETLVLTSKEFALLEFFLRNPGRVLSRTAIAEHVWDYRFDDVVSNVIDVIVSRLRAKVDRGHAVRLLHTVKGVGYVLREEA